MIKRLVTICLILFISFAPALSLAANHKTSPNYTKSSSTIVKMSKSGICHTSSSRYYSRTKHYTPFKSLKACLNAGGRLPKK